MRHFLLYSFFLTGLTNQVLAQSVTFSPAITYRSGGTGTSSVAVQDLNGDGKPDIVLANTSPTVGVLLNSGTGSFPATATTYPSGATSSNTRTIALGDVNADGKTDLVVLNPSSNYNDSNVGVLLGTGTGTFQAATTYPTARYSYPSGLAVADVNGDGRDDIVVANSNILSISVLLSRITGGFDEGVQYRAGGSFLGSLTTGDMNGDNKPDIIFSNSDGSLGILPNVGAGTFGFTPPIYYTRDGYVRSVKVGDVNNDGKLDAVTVGNNYNTTSVLLGTGTGTLGTAAVYSAGSNSEPTSVALGDFNRDGQLDLVSANYRTNSVGVLLGQGPGGFPDTATPFSTGNNSTPTDVVVADVNGDTKPDIITANYTTATVAILLNTSILPTKLALEAASVTVYPNPVHSSFQVQVPGVSGATTVVAELRNTLGQRIRQQVALLPATGTTLTLPTAELIPGIYLLQLQAGDNTLTQRVVVQ